METFSRIGLLRSYGNLQSYYTFSLITGRFSQLQIGQLTGFAETTLVTSREHNKSTLETSWKDVKTTLQTSWKDGKTTLQTSGKDGKTTLETSGED
jgi:hypothetical protein